MTVHLSARLTWHDSGWDGRVCREPLQNVSCLVHEHIRDSRDDAKEIEHAGRLLFEMDYRPPCSRDPGVYSPDGYLITHRDPLFWRNLPPVDEELPPYTLSTSPYGHMFAESGGWEYDPGSQLDNLTEFFDSLDTHRSLVFFYLKDGQPFVETSQRIIAGIGRIKNLGPQLFFGGPGDHQGRPYPIWSRAVTQSFPQEGFRLPLQEYVSEGHDPSEILCLVPQSLMSSFSYVAEHVSDDGAITMIERLMDCLIKVKHEGLIKGEWERHLAWLDQVLGEAWQDRGPYPGISSVLAFLGCPSGVTFQRQILRPLSEKGEDPWNFVEAILEGRREAVYPGHTKHLLDAGLRWRGEPEPRRELLRTLARFAVTTKQVERLAHPLKRAEAGIPFDELGLIANPYLLTEFDLGDKESEPLAFESVDHGMLPDHRNSISSIEAITTDDNRRIRALLGEILGAAAGDGDSILPLDEACRRAEQYLAHERRCLPDPVRIQAARTFFEERLTLVDNPAGQLVALRSLAEDETLVGQRIATMIERSHPQTDLNWRDIVDGVLSNTPELGSDDEDNAREEKAEALKAAFVSRFCVITGRAGTGKTTVARAFIEGVQEVDGQTSLLLLAPTGKARIRLQETTGREAKTIHQFLVENDWIHFGAGFDFKREGGTTSGASTVIVDEASMIPIDLLATLFRAINWNQVRRFVLMGDSNQLPPIGPGRPFADVIAWLTSDDERRQRLLHLRNRGRFLDAKSLGLLLSDGYATGDTPPGDDEILARVARRDVEGSDLEVHYWRDVSQLDQLLHERISALMLEGASRGDYAAIDKSFRKEDNTPFPDAWQILSPVRRHQFGTDEINRRIQLDYRRNLVEMSKQRKSLGKRQLPRPAGDQQIVANDKVIQVRNEHRRSWTAGTRGDQHRYVANGEVGIVTWAERKSSREELTVIFGTQPSLRFKYYVGEVNERLELAYAITVHKSQGSDFDTVFLVLPRSAATLSRELIYTALTRFKKKLVLLLEHDIRVLEQFRKPSESEVVRRNSNLFTLFMRPETVGFPHPENLIHRTSAGILVRSKSEVIVADTLTRLGTDYEYEKPLYAKDDNTDFRLPDFTIAYEGETWFWEHLGMLSTPSYAEAWEKKKAWYQANGWLDRVVTSQDGPDGSIDVPTIERTAKERILEV